MTEAYEFMRAANVVLSLVVTFFVAYRVTLWAKDMDKRNALFVKGLGVYVFITAVYPLQNIVNDARVGPVTAALFVLNIVMLVLCVKKPPRPVEGNGGS